MNVPGRNFIIAFLTKLDKLARFLSYKKATLLTIIELKTS